MDFEPEVSLAVLRTAQSEDSRTTKIGHLYGWSPAAATEMHSSQLKIGRPL